MITYNKLTPAQRWEFTDDLLKKIHAACKVGKWSLGVRCIQMTYRIPLIAIEEKMKLASASIQMQMCPPTAEIIDLKKYREARA
jgi:hypothetical protein